ncbi:putative extracellular tungstate binding protein [Usnea florida]
MVVTSATPTVTTPAVAPNATYHYSKSDIKSEIALRIGTGGSGQTGLLEALAQEFIKFTSEHDKRDPFAIEWYTSDTSGSIDYLHRKVVDVGITYHAIAEYTALQDGIIDRVEYVWRDHWMLVGPKNNPAEIPTDRRESIYVLLMRLFSALEQNKDNKEPRTPIKFLSRYDSSACNIKESSLWATIGQTPWAPPVATWYHMLVDFPFQAIRTASKLGEYTLTDYGTWCAIEQDVRDKLAIFAQGNDDEEDPLLNPAHLLVGTEAENKVMANKFADWMIKGEGGQKVVREFQKNGIDLYTTAPMKVDPLGRVKGLLSPDAS